MVFPRLGEYLQQLQTSQKKLLDNAYQWMIKDNTTPKAATNINTFDLNLATFIDDLIEDLDYQKFNMFFAGHYDNWSEESIQKLKDFISNGGNVIFAGADDYKGGVQRKPMRK